MIDVVGLIADYTLDMTLLIADLVVTLEVIAASSDAPAGLTSGPGIDTSE